MMRNEAIVTAKGRQWKILLVTARELGSDRLGDCDHPPGRHPTMRVNRNLAPRLMMETVAHECLHACLPELSEEAVTHAAKVIGFALYQLDFRRRQVTSKKS